MTEVREIVVKMGFRKGGFVEVSNIDGLQNGFGLRVTMGDKIVGEIVHHSADRTYIPWLSRSQNYQVGGFVDHAIRMIVSARRSGI